MGVLRSLLRKRVDDCQQDSEIEGPLPVEADWLVLLYCAETL